MRNILILNQMKLKTIKTMHGSGFYEALELSKRVNRVVFLAFTQEKRVLFRRVRHNFFVYAYPLRMTFTSIYKDSVENIKIILRILPFIKYLVRKYDINHIRAEGILPWGIISYLTRLMLGVNFSIYLVGSEIEALSRKYNMSSTGVLSKLLKIIYLVIFSAAKNVSTNVIPLYLEIKRLNERTYFLPTYIDINRFSCRNEIFQDNTVKLMYVGRFEKEKGIEILLHVLEQLLKSGEKFEFYFIGHGSYEEKVKKLSQQYGQVKFIGMVDHLEMPKWYNKADIIVLPSLTEGMPAVLMEAMACKRLVIATSVGSIPFLLKNGEYGVLIHPNNERELLNSILNIIKMKNKENLLEKARNARTRVEKLLKLYYWNLYRAIS